MSEIEILKKWVRWILDSPQAKESEKDLAKAVGNLISQVGTWKAKYEREFERLLRAEKEIQILKEHFNGQLE